MAWQYCVDLRIWRNGLRDCHLARTGATLIQRRHAIPPVMRGLRAIPIIECNLHELLGVCESRRRDLRADGRRRTEGRRRSGRRRRLSLSFEFWRDDGGDECSRRRNQEITARLGHEVLRPRIVARARHRTPILGGNAYCRHHALSMRTIRRGLSAISDNSVVARFLTKTLSLESH
jgi:hypothetical protein